MDKFCQWRVSDFDKLIYDKFSNFSEIWYNINYYMESENLTSSNSKRKTSTPIILIAIVIVAALIIYASSQLSISPKNRYGTPITENKPSSSSAGSSHKSQYKDGSYKAIGSYVSPGGSREIELTLILKNGQVVDSTFVGKANDNASKRFQGEFSDNYKALIVGKNIDEIELTKVSGSSLTPKGFNDALQKIKSQAVAG